MRHVAYIVVLVVIPLIVSMAALAMAFVVAAERPRLFYLASAMAAVAVLGYRFRPKSSRQIDANRD